MRTLLVLVLLGMSNAHSAEKADPKPVYAGVEDQRTEQQPIVVAPVNVQPITVNGDITSHASKEDAQATANSDRKKSANDRSLTNATWALAWLTFILAAIAAVQVGMFLRQLRITKDALKDAKTAADAALVSANSAKKSADALPLIERAYVYAEVRLSPDAEWQTPNELHIDIAVRLINHGKTPAVLARLRALKIIGSEPPPQELPVHDRAERTIPEGLAIGNDCEYVYHLKFTITRQQWNDLTDDVVTKMYVFGLVDYLDVLGDTRRTGYCWESYPSEGMIEFALSKSPLNYTR